MGSTAKGLALIPELAALSPSTSTAAAAAAAAVIGQGFSHGWGSWACQVQAREWMDKPYFAQDRPSGTRLETAPDPPHGIKYVKNYPPAPRSLWTVLQPRQLILSLVKSLFLQSMFVALTKLSELDRLEREAFESGEELDRVVVFPVADVKPVIKRSSILFLRDVVTQSMRQVFEVVAGQRLEPRTAWKLRKGKPASNRLQYGRDIWMTKSGWREKGVPAFMKRLLLRMFANAVKTSVCVVGASLGVLSAVWPGTGTVVGYNAADLAISLFFIGPLADRYISMEPPPAAMDAGALEGDPPIPGPFVVGADDQALQGILDDSSDDEDHAAMLDNGEHPTHEAATGSAPAA
ncbi:MAG: hypothetical protein FRX49_10621 [Trebouxia sp. A1-2]|nr:MAG: hypothetical protein FRX49_10621 [Trebouxia sp. A1-2]